MASSAVDAANPVTSTDDGLYIGLMSGTSADGIDVALCRFGPRAELLHALVHPWPSAVHDEIVRWGQAPGSITLHDLGSLDTRLGEGFADAVEVLLAASGVERTAVRAIGSHGQTVCHGPQGEHPFTLQLGNPWVISERCRIDVVSDFRRADMAAGGQGAPLMPAFHAAMLGGQSRARAILNLGGIANLTRLPVTGDVQGFDTGPANGLMDAWAEHVTGEPMDVDGAMAARGVVDEPLLRALLADPYFVLAPPKSTGREYFHLDWLRDHARIADVAPDDVQATLLALTVTTIASAVERFMPEVVEVLACGGGVHNRVLMTALRDALAPRDLATTARHGVDPDYLEAMGFAWLAQRRMHGLPGNLPAVTGASGPRVLGSLCPAPRG